MTLTAPLKKIRLNLARSRLFPDGSTWHGYEFIAPLDDAGKIDLTAWKSHRSACKVRRFWGDGPESKGLLVHRRGGIHGATWGFDYDPASHDDDEAGYRFGDGVSAVNDHIAVGS